MKYETATADNTNYKDVTGEMMVLNPTVITEASALRWPVGKCPRIVETTLGNGQPFDLIRIDRNSDGEALKANFKQRNGVLGLIVFND